MLQAATTFGDESRECHTHSEALKQLNRIA
jgi:hypothetical protein